MNLTDELIPWIDKQMSPALLEFDSEGKLRDACGHLELYGLESLTHGTDVEQIDFLATMLPVATPFELPIVSSQYGVPRRVHISPTHEGGTHVLLLDASEEEQALQRIIQVENEKRLSAERDVPSGAVASSGLAVLEKTATGFRVLGQPPEWFRGLLPPLRFLKPRILYEHLSFLEFFLTQAETAWRSGGMERTRWIEADEQGNEYEIRASAFLAGERPIIVLSSQPEDYAERQRILQKARVMHLAAERQTKDIEKKDILLHSIVHDLIAPLGVITGTLAMLSDDTQDPAKRRMCDIALRQCKRQEQMIRDILDVFSADVARLDAFSTNPSTAPDARGILQEVVESMQPVFTAKRVTLAFDSARPDLSAQVSGEEARLERVYVNLLENALRYTPPGCTVNVRLTVEPKYVEVEVKDQGPGIETVMLDKLFQKFSQGREKSGKVGLGLFFCRITVERWGGAVGAQNDPGGGARFWLRLPRVFP